MSSIAPPSKPAATIADIMKYVQRAGVTDKVVIVGIRGYYKRTMGNPLTNDRGIYDDAFFVVTPTCFASFNGNTDPSAFRPGVASLCPGVHRYRPGNHGITRPGGGYPAFRPATKNEALPVTRDGQPGTSLGIAINIHKGSNQTTSSEGCQTVPPPQWDAFQALVMSQLKLYGQKDFPYVLVEA